MKRIGILAGTFDPVHVGHLAFAQEALNSGLKKVYFLVEPRPRRKQGVKALEHRLAMVKLAVRDNKQLGVIQLEQARFDIAKTLPVLKSRFKNYELSLLFGDDIVSHMVEWPLIEELAKSVRVIVACRTHDTKELKEKLENLFKARRLKLKYEFIYPDKTNISSSKIRLAFKRRKKPQGMSLRVEKYIRQNRIYSAAGAADPK